VTRNKAAIDDLRRKIRDAAARCDLDGLHHAVVEFYEGTGREPPPDSEEPREMPNRPIGALRRENACGND
jgi:hypothetical protein